MERRPKVNKYPLTWVLTFQFFEIKKNIKSDYKKWSDKMNGKDDKKPVKQAPLRIVFRVII